ncbi:hypothetical protein P4S91_06770 [Aneurinibacillus aneurinilyticus]|jgi:hypothetical protein|uniref:Uncharacterized protein n=1 Tax=Aneurinibacillus aneurinilyticus ATCC 12856 TaxID=649747 RepID=U1YEZ5_ANEAE|nr:hypothetical protein [Aneurinibacillus aneurinilyticus]ERI10662.1 hypothetical protein HMPREF0083_01232 [Aneurinibacillus aneurinilyticus ATCC 12856]MED0704761.1 hypothetical protein [Aneurinibacillus aneurinilyticus]MED0722636.1 hypothetical protein [Aneurinibacillus aneurinilyticus]MED0730885.1 hypothetical protein [Aneurinibacillus aneurinilyticus]MED0740506.1 hypothetical protein [Aneurinibacillus aneurinilyticus]
MNRENGVARFDVGEAVHDFGKFDFFEIGKKDFNAVEARGILQ